MKNFKNAEEKREILNENSNNEEYDWEARQNLFGFFGLLLEVDKRINPHLYEKTKK